MKILFAVLISLSTLACASSIPPTIQTPEGKRAYTVNEIVLRINQFQRVVIDASDQKLIPVPIAREIVTWTVTSLKSISAAPQGWQALLKKTWLEVRERVEKIELLSHWTFVFDVMLEVV